VKLLDSQEEIGS